MRRSSHRINGLLRPAAALCAWLMLGASTIPAWAMGNGAQDSAHSAVARQSYPWVPDNGDGTYTNPVIHADYSDPDVVRVGREYYMVSSSFVQTPGLPVLRSTDLVNWTVIGYCIQNLPSPLFDRVQHGKGVWAPSIRYHNGEFYVYFGDPDRGIFMTRARHASGPWRAPVCVKEAKGWIDPCPLWDTDGTAYLVHAWAKSRAGFNSVLSLNRMNAEGTRVLDEGHVIFDGHAHQPTIEGPKFYKRNGWYYIFAPAGGVKPGWQTVLRSKHIDGPYEDRIVMDQGATRVNGPHQGAWVVTPDGREDWFIHFQDRYAFGRIIHLQPMVWKNDWPVIGRETVASGKGEPVSTFRMPKSVRRSSIMIPQTSDEFDRSTLGLQWQWEGNHRRSWYSLAARKGSLRLVEVPAEDTAWTLWEMPNLLMQKFPAPAFTVTTRLDGRGLAPGARTGLVVFGLDYATIGIRRETSGALVIERRTCLKADRQGRESVVDAPRQRVTFPIDLRVDIDTAGSCVFSWSGNGGHTFAPLGDRFTAREGMWVGAKVGLYARAANFGRTRGYAEYQYFKFQ